MKAILFYKEEDTFIPNERTIIDQWCAMDGMTHLVIDKTQKLRQTNGNIFSTIEDAVRKFPNHEFVFMSEKATKTLDQYTHPIDNVIYCVGSDTDGFQNFDISGYPNFQLKTTVKQGNHWYASSVVPMIIADRMLRI